jgi:hypothetical protein
MHKAQTAIAFAIANPRSRTETCKLKHKKEVKMKARSDNSFLEHSHSGLHRFEDTDLGALEWR